MLNRVTWHTSIWSQAKLKLPFPQYPFLTLFLTKKEYYGNEDLRLNNLVHFYMILYNLIWFSYTLIRLQGKHLYFFYPTLIFKKITFYKSKKYLFNTTSRRHSMFCKVWVTSFINTTKVMFPRCLFFVFIKIIKKNMMVFNKIHMSTRQLSNFGAILISLYRFL